MTHPLSNSIDTVTRSLDALHYLNQLLDLAINADGSALADMNSGLSHLMGRQLEDIGGALAVLDDAAKAGKFQSAKEAPQWHDIDTIAARARVHKCEVARVLFVLTGQDHAGAAYQAFDGHKADGLPAHLLSALIHRTLAHGAIWGQVSTATGLELDKVKEVLEAMLQYTPMRKSITLQGFDTDDDAAVDRVAEKLTGAMSQGRKAV